MKGEEESTISYQYINHNFLIYVCLYVHVYVYLNTDRSLERIGELFLTKEYHLTNVEEMKELEKSPLCKHQGNHWFGQEPSNHRVRSSCRAEYTHSLKLPLLVVCYCLQRTKSNCTERLVDTTLIKWRLNLATLIMGPTDVTGFWCDPLRNTQNHIGSTLTKNVWPKSMYKKLSEKRK